MNNNISNTITVIHEFENLTRSYFVDYIFSFLNSTNIDFIYNEKLDILESSIYEINSFLF